MILHLYMYRTLAGSFQYHWRNLHQMSVQQSSTSVDIVSTATNGDSSIDNGSGQTNGEAPINQIEQSVNPAPPTMEELEQSTQRCVYTYSMYYAPPCIHALIHADSV